MWNIKGRRGLDAPGEREPEGSAVVKLLHITHTFCLMDSFFSPSPVSFKCNLGRDRHQQHQGHRGAWGSRQGSRDRNGNRRRRVRGQWDYRPHNLRPTSGDGRRGGPRVLKIPGLELLWAGRKDIRGHEQCYVSVHSFSLFSFFPAALDFQGNICQAINQQQMETLAGRVCRYSDKWTDGKDGQRGETHHWYAYQGG